MINYTFDKDWWEKKAKNELLTVKFDLHAAVNMSMSGITFFSPYKPLNQGPEQKSQDTPTNTPKKGQNS